MDILFTTDEQGNTHLNLGQPKRKLTPLDAHQMWLRLYGEGTLANHELRSYRMAIGWRLTREMAYRQGRLHRDERLVTALQEQDYEDPTPMGQATRTPKSEDSDTWTIKQLLALAGGLALRPIGNPDHDARFCSMVMKLADAMWLLRGSKDLPHLGHYGLQGLTHPSSVAELWPTLDDMLHFEDVLIDQIRGFILKLTKRRAIERVQTMIDLSTNEVGGLFALAAQEVRALSIVDIEINRAITVAQVEEVAFNARDAGDYRTELAALKHKAELEGVTKAERGNELEAVIGLISQVAKEQSEDILQVEAKELDSEFPTPKEDLT